MNNKVTVLLEKPFLEVGICYENCKYQTKEFSLCLKVFSNNSRNILDLQLQVDKMRQVFLGSI